MDKSIKTFTIFDLNCLLDDVADQLKTIDPHKCTYEYTGTLDELRNILYGGDFTQEDVDTGIQNYLDGKTSSIFIDGEVYDGIEVQVKNN